MDSKADTQQGRSRGRRHSRRRANHQSADHAGPRASVPDHPLIVATDAELIETPDALADLIDHIRAVGCFAYDTEFIGELSYYPQLCVVQVATRERLAVVDTLAELDLTGVWELLADESIRKIVHAGSQDLEPVVRHLGKAAANVWDTQIAAGFAGLPYPLSLTKLVEETVGVRLGKGLTFTSWDERPLSPGHVRYAADDVRYLLAVAEELDKRLAATGHAAWAQQECAAACDPRQFVFDPQTQLRRMRGAKGLKPKQLAILAELAAVRDAGARERDLPPRSFVKDEVLVDLARNPVRHAEKLANVRGLPKPVVLNYGQHLIEAIQRGAQTPRDERPKVQTPPDETPLDRLRHEAIWAVASAWCLAQGIDPSLVGSRSDIARLLCAVTEGPCDVPDRLQDGWRRELLDAFFRRFVAGERPLTVWWGEKGLRLGEQ